MHTMPFANPTHPDSARIVRNAENMLDMRELSMPFSCVLRLREKQRRRSFQEVPFHSQHF